jgi:hypothetical protein
MKVLNLPTIIIWKKSGKVTWVGHVVRMGEIKKAFSVLVGILEEKAYIGGYY